MRFVLFIFMILLSDNGFSQDDSTFLNRFLLGQELVSGNNLSAYSDIDFSSIWMTAPNHRVFGIIGSDHQRLRIKILNVTKSNDGNMKYDVFGKSMVKGNICDFSGTIEIEAIRNFKTYHLGVDRMYADSNIQDQGILIARYAFIENSEQSHSGTFEGFLYSKWYLDKNRMIRYDDIQSMSDGYMNNAFLGTWTNHANDSTKICNWGEYRVPAANQDFDIGAGEFSPSEKYYDKGWKEYQDAWLHSNENGKRKELEMWWE